MVNDKASIDEWLTISTCSTCFSVYFSFLHICILNLLSVESIFYEEIATMLTIAAKNNLFIVFVFSVNKNYSNEVEFK